MEARAAKLALASVLAMACLPAAAQLNKCVAADGKVSYSDRACPTSQKAAAVTAPPIAEPTSRDAAAADLRRRLGNLEAREIEIRRAAAERSAGQAQRFSIGRPQARSTQLSAPQPDRALCIGIQNRMDVSKMRNPLAFDRTIEYMELLRAQQRHCPP
jgi:hypothetical protein